MDTVFDASLWRAPDRARAWVEALNDTYVCLDSTPGTTANYNGFLRKVEYGDVLITDTGLSAQTIHRRSDHIARLDKDCFYIQFLSQGQTQVDTMGRTLTANQVTGTLFSASEAYDLHCGDGTRSWWLEIDRAALMARGARDRDLDPGLFSFGQGLGRLAYDHMLSLASEETAVHGAARHALGNGLIDLLVLALQDPARAEIGADHAGLSEIKLRNVQGSIRRLLDKPGLTPSEIATRNGISVGHLHRIFRESGMTVSEWLREERLKRSYGLLTSNEWSAMSITDIAFACGFSSSSHFSRSFRARYGQTPRDLRAHQKRCS